MAIIVVFMTIIFIVIFIHACVLCDFSEKLRNLGETVYVVKFVLPLNLIKMNNKKERKSILSEYLSLKSNVHA